MTFTVHYHIEVAIPRRRNGIDGINMSLTGSIPFLPCKGMFIIAAPDDDYREVDMVQWDFREPDVLHVWFEGIEVEGWANTLKAMGWKEDK